MRFGSVVSGAVAAVLLLGSLGCGSDDGLAVGAGASDGSSNSSAPQVPSPTSAVAGGEGGSDGTSSANATPGVGGGDFTSSAGSGVPEACLGEDFLTDLGKDHVMVGARLDEPLAATTPLDLRYTHLTGLLPDGEGPCESCATGCVTDGMSCSSEEPGGCDWWGCWPSDDDVPGAYLRDFAATARERGQIPMVTYSMVVSSSGADEGVAEIVAMNDAAYLRRYLSDFRFVLQSLGEGPALVQVEPGFWGYVQQLDPNPYATPAAVPEANPEECGDEEPSIAGLGRCLVKMARLHAPDAKIGLHGSGWSTAIDVLQNDDTSVDVVAEATALGAFLSATAPDADLVFIDATDRDAGYSASIGRETWWDDTNMTLPNFHQAFDWSRTLSETMARPHLWWQLPFGNMSLPGGSTQWTDNRLDYFFSHMGEVAAAHGVGIAFGAGAGGQVTAESDGGNFASKASDYADAGGQPLCLE